MGDYDWHVLSEYLGVACDCEDYHICDWHQRLKTGETLYSMGDELWNAYHERLYEAYRGGREE
jgi:hypothetical protein